MKNTDQNKIQEEGVSSLNNIIATQSINYLKKHPEITFEEITQKLAGWGDTTEIIISAPDFKQICIDRFGKTIDSKFLMVS